MEAEHEAAVAAQADRVRQLEAAGQGEHADANDAEIADGQAPTRWSLRRRWPVQHRQWTCSGGLPSPAKLVTAEVEISLVSYM